MLFRLTVVATALSASSFAFASAAKKYDIVELPRLCDPSNPTECGEFSYAYGINDSGMVVGFSNGPMVTDTDDRDDDGNVTEEVRDFASHAFSWEAGAITDLGDLGKNESYAFSVNSYGEIVGRGNKVTAVDGTKETVQFRGFRIPVGGPMADIGVPAEVVNLVSPTDIAEDGYVVGFASARVITDDTAFYTRGFISAPGSSAITLISALQDKTTSVLRAVSNLNDATTKAVGYSIKDGFSRAIQVDLAAPSTLIDLQTLGGTSAEANDINVYGHVVGRSYTTNNAAIEAFLYEQTATPAMRGLGQLGSSFRFSQANAINDAGDIVGTAQAATGPVSYHATIYSSADSEAKLIDLNKLIDCSADPSSRWVLTEAVGINGAGQIIGYGNKGTAVRAFLLTPNLDEHATPVSCGPVEPEFENQSGGGVFGLLVLPLLLLRRRYID